MCDTYTIVEKFRVNLVGKVNVERWVYFNARKKLKWWRRVGILCDGCDGWRRKMVLTVLQFFLYMYEVLGGLSEWVEV